MDDSPARQALTHPLKDDARLGLLIGPVLLGSIVANGIFRITCEGRSSFVTAGAGSPFALFLFLLLIVLLLSGKIEPPVRLGVIGFAILQALRVYAWLSESRLPDFVGWLELISAALFLIAGLRSSARHPTLIAVSVFLVMFGFGVFSQRFGREVIGRTTVMNDSFLCRS